jgi:hypothetical protein
VAWFSHLLDAYDPGRLGRAVDVRTTALDHASRKADHDARPTQPTQSQPTQPPPAWQPPWWLAWLVMAMAPRRHLVLRELR